MADAFSRATDRLFSDRNVTQAATYIVDRTKATISLRVAVHRDVQPEISDMEMQTPDPHTEISIRISDLSATPVRGDTVTITDTGEVFTIRQKPIRNDGYVYRAIVR